MAVGNATLELPVMSTAPGIAREFVRRCLHPLDADILDAVALCVSELVTNALDHAKPPYELRVQRTPKRLRIEVADACEHPPVLQALSPDATRGRGIFLVESIATRWGVESTSEGKTVWAEFATA